MTPSQYFKADNTLNKLIPEFKLIQICWKN